MLLVPFILSSQSASNSDADAEASSADLARKLAALRHYADRLTVFAQADNIHTPATYQAFHAFLEHAVVQVTAPLSGLLFHPKIWALRFTTPGREPLHRLVVSSRNITADTSSDTILTCDQAAPGADHALDAAPLVDFLRALTQLSGAPAGLALAHRAQVDSFVASLVTTPPSRFPTPSSPVTWFLWACPTRTWTPSGRSPGAALPGASFPRSWTRDTSTHAHVEPRVSYFRITRVPSTLTAPNRRSSSHWTTALSMPWRGPSGRRSAP